MRDIWICVQTDAAGNRAIATIMDTEGRHVAADYDLARLEAVAEIVRADAPVTVTIHKLSAPVVTLPPLERAAQSEARPPSWLLEPSRSS